MEVDRVTCRGALGAHWGRDRVGASVEMGRDLVVEAVHQSHSDSVTRLPCRCCAPGVESLLSVVTKLCVCRLILTRIGAQRGGWHWGVCFSSP